MPTREMAKPSAATISCRARSGSMLFSSAAPPSGWTRSGTRRRCTRDRTRQCRAGRRRCARAAFHRRVQSRRSATLMWPSRPRTISTPVPLALPACHCRSPNDDDDYRAEPSGRWLSKGWESRRLKWTSGLSDRKHFDENSSDQGAMVNSAGNSSAFDRYHVCAGRGRRASEAGRGWRSAARGFSRAGGYPCCRCRRRECGDGPDNPRRGSRAGAPRTPRRTCTPPPSPRAPPASRRRWCRDRQPSARRRSAGPNAGRSSRCAGWRYCSAPHVAAAILQRIRGDSLGGAVIVESGTRTAAPMSLEIGQIDAAAPSMEWLGASTWGGVVGVTLRRTSPASRRSQSCRGWRRRPPAPAARPPCRTGMERSIRVGMGASPAGGLVTARPGDYKNKHRTGVQVTIESTMSSWHKRELWKEFCADYPSFSRAMRCWCGPGRRSQGRRSSRSLRACARPMWRSASRPSSTNSRTMRRPTAAAAGRRRRRPSRRNCMGGRRPAEPRQQSQLLLRAGGVLATHRDVEKAGLTIAGSGPDLQAASAPRRVARDGGSLALVAATAAPFAGYGRASESRSTAAARWVSIH